MKKISMALGLLFIAALLTGCASSGNNLRHDIKFSETKQIIAGQSTKEEVRALLGPPHTVTTDATGNEIWSYSFTHSSELSFSEQMGQAAIGGALAGALGPFAIPIGYHLRSRNPDKKSDISFDNRGIVNSLICRDKKVGEK
jgi:outer membrane protein assembly factor BamE (lipoprotein component of BamABCDE complex)